MVLVRPFTEAEDVGGFFAAKGILTSEGGKASHAALVARGMGRPAVTGASDLEIDLGSREVRVNGTTLHEGDSIAIDGTSGVVTVDDVPLVDPEVDDNFQKVLEWCRRDPQARRAHQRRHAGGRREGTRVRRRGDRPVPHRAHVHGRRPPAEDARDDHGRDEEDRRAALDELLPLQQEDFEGLFEEMAGLPVTIRLLDPPLHEFLPGLEEIASEVERARIERSADLEELERTLDRVHSLQETNPMLGTRGCRLGILHPEIYEMQVRAIVRAAKAVGERAGKAPELEIMIPLVAYEKELEIMRAARRARGRRRRTATASSS